jgi:hypothetical protein
MIQARHGLHLLLALGLALAPAPVCAASSFDIAIAPGNADASTETCGSAAECCCTPQGEAPASHGDREFRTSDCPCAVPQPTRPTSPSAPVTSSGASLVEMLASPLLVATLVPQPGCGREAPRASRSRAGPSARNVFCVRLL